MEKGVIEWYFIGTDKMPDDDKKDLFVAYENGTVGIAEYIGDPRILREMQRKYVFSNGFWSHKTEAGLKVIAWAMVPEAPRSLMLKIRNDEKKFLRKQIKDIEARLHEVEAQCDEDADGRELTDEELEREGWT